MGKERNPHTVLGTVVLSLSNHHPRVQRTGALHCILMGGSVKAALSMFPWELAGRACTMAHPVPAADARGGTHSASADLGWSADRI